MGRWYHLVWWYQISSFPMRFPTSFTNPLANQSPTFVIWHTMGALMWALLLTRVPSHTSCSLQVITLWQSRQLLWHIHALTCTLCLLVNHPFIKHHISSPVRSSLQQLHLYLSVDKVSSLRTLTAVSSPACMCGLSSTFACSNWCQEIFKHHHQAGQLNEDLTELTKHVQMDMGNRVDYRMDC